MKRVTTSMVMPGGWHKPEVDRLGRQFPTPIRAATYDLLITAVAKFRADNGIPVGEPQKDVDDYICSAFPRQCNDFASDASVSIAIPQAVTLTDKMLQVMEKQLENHSEERLELKQEAARRADICRGCPFNVRWNTGCGACFEAVNRMSATLRIGNHVPRDRDLRACRLLCHENRSAVWLRLEHIGTSTDLPGFCWARK
jgi:hypothetical protein